mmetsp:Transcript_17046/g.25807  ORF Transcript_17046/g.25807 Transcript_17046/m.25807 type:complete len:567 (+) Transcript_17046:45-1745(+)
MPIKTFIFFAPILILHAFILIQAREESCDPKDGSCIPSEEKKSWIDDVGEETQRFLKEKIFGQDQIDSNGHNFLSMTAGGTNEREAHGENPFANLLDRLAESGTFFGDNRKEDSVKNKNNTLLASLVDRINGMHSKEQKVTGKDFLNVMTEALKKAQQQLKATFKDIIDDIEISITVAMVYFLEREDSQKNPSWKRRQHRFYDQVSKPLVMELHEALYISQLTYVNTVEDFRDGLIKFQNGVWELGYGTTDSLPNSPAHFLLIHKNVKPLNFPEIRSLLPWEGNSDSELLVTLAVRGTKNLPDIIADILLEPVEYRGGYAHGGILENGISLAKKVLPKLEQLLKHSGRDKIRLYLVGHSLGAAAASIAAMELHDHDWIHVEAVGFGCPSLLSLELSQSTKDYITTVVADADIVPRMSGASLANLLLDLMEYDWTEVLLEDIEYSLEKARTTSDIAGFILPKTDDVLDWARSLIDGNFRPLLNKAKRERISSTLIPPGTCIHFYRDGKGYSGSFVPCDFFSSVDFARTLIDDHMIISGYHRAMLTIFRDWEQNYNFDFSHDIASIPA